MVSIKIISSRTDTFTSLDLIHAYLNNREWKMDVCIYCSWYIDFICVNPFHKPSSVYFYPSQNQNTTYYHISEYSCQYIAIYIFMKNFLKGVCELIRNFSYDLKSIIPCIDNFLVILSCYSSSGLVYW